MTDHYPIFDFLCRFFPYIDRIIGIGVHESLHTMPLLHKQREKPQSDGVTEQFPFH
jgi:hypothetical protein